MLKSQKGITLVEIMLAVLIFGIGISMAIRTVPESSVITTRSRNITTATNLAAEKVEELMSFSWGHAELSGGNHSDADNPISLHYQRSWTVTDDVPIQGMKRISVTVSFPTASTDSTVTLDTFITSRR
ncbi:MAG: type II secretion system protein [Candidatus Latescibacterota bacterium]